MWHFLVFSFNFDAKLFICQLVLSVANRLLCTEFFIEQLVAACMTWDLAESGKNFITTIINGSDLVPTFSAASVDDLRSEVCDLRSVNANITGFIPVHHRIKWS